MTILTSRWLPWLRLIVTVLFAALEFYVLRG
jgi:hypothetical protein